MFRVTFTAMLLALVFFSVASADDINEYTVLRVDKAPVIDGVLDDASWSGAEETSAFVNYKDGSAVRREARGMMLWDDNYLYIGIRCEDHDIKATYTEHDAYLWEENEVVEAFIDPDGDTLNYVEYQINPLGTQMELLMSKPYSDGGSSDFDFALPGVQAAVNIEGTINDSENGDTAWTAEVAIPFDALASVAPGKSFPPKDGDDWRINLYRYNVEEKPDSFVELSAWNKTITGGFHNPSRFGRIIFSDDTVTSTSTGSLDKPSSFAIAGNYPNPFNPDTTITVSVPEDALVSLEIYNVLGQQIRVFDDRNFAAGIHAIHWDGTTDNGMVVTSGVYLARLTSGSKILASHTMTLAK